MKKILLFLISLSSLAFSACYLPGTYGTGPYDPSTCSGTNVNGSCTLSRLWLVTCKPGMTNYPTKPDYWADDDEYCVPVGDGNLKCSPQPENGKYDGEGNLNCNNGYGSLNGGCSELPANSDGFEEDGTPKCIGGYEAENGFCVLPTGTKPDGQCEDGYTKIIDKGCQPNQTGGNGDSSTGGSGDGDSGSGGSSGGSSGNGDNNSGGDTGSGGGSTGGNGDSNNNGSGGSSGGGVGGESGNGGGNNETPPAEVEPPQESTPETDEATNYDDDNLTMTEKLLCEMKNNDNSIKSVNNTAIKDLKESNNQAFGAINANVKSTNELLKALKDNQTADNKKTNDTLNSVKSTNVQINTKLHTLTGSLSSVDTGISKSNGFLENLENGMNTVTDFLSTVTELISNPSTIGDKLSNQLSIVANKYTQKFLEDSTCPNIQTISIDYHGTNVTFLSQALIDKYFPIEIMRTIIILTFAFAGFMNFFRGAN